MRFLLLLLAFTATAPASVLVYQGTARTALPSTLAQFGKMPRVYFVVDLATKQSYQVYYFTLAGKKGSQGFPQFEATRYVAQALSATKTAGTFSYVNDTSMGSSIGVNMFYFRGTQVPLVISNSGAPVLGNFPKTLGGLFRIVQFQNGNPSLFELNLTLTFDAAHTQLANNGFKTGAQAYDDLQSELIQKGF